jgi:hypothetical protein
LKRTAFDVLRRGLDNVVANWQLLVLRIGESLLFFAITIAGILAAVVPLLVSIGLKPPQTPEDITDLAELILNHWVALTWIFVAAMLLVSIFLFIHTFVQAGSARIYIDGDRAAGPAVEGVRERYHVFTVERWMAGGREGFWRVFWVYNLAWLVAGVILLLPLVVTLLFSLLLGGVPAVALGISCLGIIVTLFLGFAVAIVTSIWSQKAIVITMARLLPAREALAAAWADLKRDTARHVVVAVLIWIVSFAVSSVFSIVSSVGQLQSSMAFRHAFGPLEIASWMVTTVISAAIGAWFLASFTSLLEE